MGNIFVHNDFSLELCGLEFEIVMDGPMDRHLVYFQSNIKCQSPAQSLKARGRRLAVSQPASRRAGRAGLAARYITRGLEATAISMALPAVAVLVLLAAVRARGEAQCAEEDASLYFTVTSLTNTTGHRTVTAQLMHQFPGRGGRRENGTSLDVRQSSGRCGDLHYLRLATSAVTAMTPTELPLLAVPSGYEHFPGAGRYKLYMTPRTWADAQETCQSDGANLVVINSEAEADVIRKIYARKTPDLSHTGVWAGFHAQFKPGQFVTVFGGTLSREGYDKWAGGQPAAGKHCGYTYKDALLNTWDCANNLVFVCELQQ